VKIDIDDFKKSPIIDGKIAASIEAYKVKPKLLID